jgi:hypothetical protein
MKSLVIFGLDFCGLEGSIKCYAVFGILLGLATKSSFIFIGPFNVTSDITMLLYLRFTFS